jgi:hypothetical protein
MCKNCGIEIKTYDEIIGDLFCSYDCIEEYFERLEFTDYMIGEI